MSSRIPFVLRTGIRFRFMSSGFGEFGSGAGKGGGSGGSIREAGGAFGKMEAANEEMYFKKLEHEQLKQIKERHVAEHEDYHNQRIKIHQEGIDRHKKQIEELHHKAKADSTKPPGKN